MGLLAAAALAGLYVLRLQNYLLFHTVTEGFTIVIACGVFMVAWNSRRFLDNHYFLVLGIASLFGAGLNMAHTLAYKGMPIFEGGQETDLATQLWIVLRYYTALSFLAAPIWIGRRLPVVPAFVVAGAAAAGLLAAVFAGVFPACFVGDRQTAFKVASEFVISGLFLAGLGLLYGRRHRFERGLWTWVAWSILLAVACDLSFTLYKDPYDVLNMLGHGLDVASFGLLYKAVIETGVARPFDLLFHNLKRSEEALRAANDDLEVRVAARTAELSRAVAALEAEAAARAKAQAQLHKVNLALRTISECNQALARATDERALLADVCRIIVGFEAYRVAWVGYAEDDPAKTIRPMACAGAPEGYLESLHLVWADVPHGRGPTGTAIRTGRPALVEDVTADPSFALWQNAVLRMGCGSALALPLSDGRRTFGAIGVLAVEPRAFDAENLTLLKEMADNLAFGIMAVRARAEREGLQREILNISEQEQRRIGQDLHDALGQTLLGISFMSTSLAQRLATQGSAESDKAAEIAALIKAAMKQARALAHGLAPVELTAQGLMAALGELARNVADRFPIACRLDCPTPVLVHDATAAIHLYRIAQEAVNNAAKHAEARHVIIALQQTDGVLTLTVDDDGLGRPESLASATGAGVGIMKYRASMIGAQLQIAASPHGGIRVECSLPRPPGT